MARRKRRHRKRIGGVRSVPVSYDVKRSPWIDVPWYKRLWRWGMGGYGIGILDPSAILAQGQADDVLQRYFQQAGLQVERENGFQQCGW